MIALSIQKILDKQDLTDEERLQLVYWFESMQNAPQQLQTLFAGGASRISAVSQITPNLGVMVSGKFIAPSSIATSNIPTEAGFTGSFMSGNGETFSGNVYNIGGVNAGVLQWGAKQSDGTLTAGGGVISIDENGFSIDTPAVAGDQYSYKFTRGGSTVGGLFANQLGANSNLIQLYGTSSVFPRVQIKSRATDQTTGAGQVWLLATLEGAITTYAEIILNASPTGSSIVLNSGLYDTDTIVRGDTDENLIYVDASTDRVGIGTATPGYKLDVAGTVNVSTGNTYKINGTDVLSSTATGRTQEEIEDFVGAMVSGNTETGISVTYDDTGGKLNFDAQTAGDARYTMLDGWISGSGTWSYSSADSPTFVISINADVTALIGVGDRIKLTQTTAKYFIVTAVGAWSGSATLVTVYGGTDYTLANAAISSPYYSHAKIPFGFPQDPDKWTVSASNSVNANKTPPSANTWYGGAGLTNTGISIDVPIGIWKGFYKGVLESTDTTVTDYNIYATLSTANNTESDTNNTFFVALTVPSGTYKIWSVISPPVTVNVAAKTTYYMNIKTSTSTADSIHIRGDVVPTIVKLVCAYL